MFCAHHQLSQVTWLQKMEYYMPFNLVSNGVCVAVNNSIISLSANWSKPSIWHHVLFFLTINNAVIISSVCSTFRRKKQVVQLANKAKLWPHMQSASLVSALHTNSICYMVVITDWHIFICWTAGCSHSCRVGVGVCLMSSFVCVIFVYFWMQKKSHLAKTIQYMLIYFTGFYTFMMWK